MKVGEPTSPQQTAQKKGYGSLSELVVCTVAVRAVASAAAPALLLGVLLAPLHPRRTS